MVSGVDTNYYLELLSSLISILEEENQLLLLAGRTDTQAGFFSRTQLPLNLSRNLSRKKDLCSIGTLLKERITN